MISKELYIEIFKPDTSMITLDEYDVILEDEILYLRNRHTLFNADEVCVYKAAHKCKEWACRQKIKPTTDTYYNGCGRSQTYPLTNMHLMTEIRKDGSAVCKIDNGKDLSSSLEFYGITFFVSGTHTYLDGIKVDKLNEVVFFADTEPKAIFKCAEWILKETR